jgi:hypothetical protein
MAGPAELEELRTAYEHAFTRDRRRGDLLRERTTSGALFLEKAVFPEKTTSGLADSSFYRRGRLIAARILRVPPARIVLGGFFIRKPPGAGETIAHQHPAVNRPPGFVEGTTIWMTLDGVDTEDGCLTFLPGSHRRGFLPYDDLLRVVPGAIDLSQSVALPLRPGGAVVIHDRVVHGALPNSTRRSRRAAALYCMSMRR